MPVDLWNEFLEGVVIHTVPRHYTSRHRHHRHHKEYVLFVVVHRDEHRNLISKSEILLIPNKEVKMADINATVGHTITYAIGYLDAQGNPMMTAPVPDSPPAWSNSTPATGTLVASADGMTAVETAVAPGSDIVSLSLVVGGVKFGATQGLIVVAPAQVLTSIAILATVA